MNWRATRLNALALVVSACQSAQQEPKPDAPRSGEVAAEPAGAGVQSSVLQVRERGPAGEPNAAPAARAGSPKPAAPPATPPVLPVSAKRRLAASSAPALGSADAERFGRLKAAIERANAEVERNRPRSQTENGAQSLP